MVSSSESSGLGDRFLTFSNVFAGFSVRFSGVLLILCGKFHVFFSHCFLELGGLQEEGFAVMLFDAFVFV